MRDLSKYDEIIIWGACFSPKEIEGEATSHGHAAEKLYKLLLENGYDNKIVMWVDSNKKLHGKKRYGIEIKEPKEILNHKNAVIIINSLSIQAILRDIDSMKMMNDILIIPYYFYHGTLDYPYDNKLAYQIIENHENEILEMFNLEDEETNRYINIILQLRKREDDLYSREFYEMTGKNMDYFCDPAIAPLEDVTLIDVGAYEGESIEPIRLFYGDRFKYCYAFEPDTKSFEHLQQYVSEKNLEDRCKIFPYALGIEEKILLFSETGSTSQLSNMGNYEVQQRRFDDLEIENVIGTPMIKMDIEGAEEGALLGMKEFIQEHKPYLAICIYHKEDDIYRIPKLIKSFYSGYKLYIRGGWHLEVWAVPDR